MADIRSSLAEFGADPSALYLLDEEAPELLPYSTLTTARRHPCDAVRAIENLL